MKVAGVLRRWCGPRRRSVRRGVACVCLVAAGLLSTVAAFEATALAAPGSASTALIPPPQTAPDSASPAPALLRQTPPAPDSAPDAAGLFAEGNRLYQEGDYAAAARHYQAVLDRGLESAALHFNLGNAHYRLGTLAPAILAWERAARLEPRNPDVRANLELARQMLQDRIEPLPRFWLLAALEWWLELLPRGWLAAASAFAYGVLGAGVTLLVLRRPRGARWLRALRRASWSAGACAIVLGGTLAARELGVGQPEEAIVMADEVRVLSAPSEEGGLTVFTLHEGAKVRIDRRAAGWVEVVLADGRVGWLQTDLLEAI